MDEEIDYMSDEFIKNCVNSANDRPSLLKTYTQQRKHNLLKKNAEIESKKKPIAVLQAEVREESLKQPIQTSNKGFSMLEKMGFKTGMGLGKDSSGIKEPIGINIKNDKVGLGHKSAIRMKSLRKSETKSDKINEDDFRAFLFKKNQQRRTCSDLKKSQRMCKELDLKHNKDLPEESWFWPGEESESEGDDDGDNEELKLSDSEKLEMLTKYLRENYFYCIWCKVKYEDEKDMEDCPGLTRDDH